MPPFSIGADVVILTLAKKRGVVIAVARDGRCQVRVEQVTMWCRDEDLAAPPELKTKRRAPKTRERIADAEAGAPAQSSRIDLHGLTVEEATARVLTEIDHALRRGDDRLEIVHGKGAGRLKDALHRQLPRISVVRAFKIDARNLGATWVYF